MISHVDPVALLAAVGGERRSMVEHVRSCPSCRAAVLAHDPAAIFSLLADTPIPARLLDEVSVEVARRTGSDRTGFGAIVASIPSLRMRLAAAAVAGVALLGAVAVLRGQPVPAPVADLAPEPIAAPSQRADVDVYPARAVSQVVDFTVGDTQVVMVYNGDLKL